MISLMLPPDDLSRLAGLALKAREYGERLYQYDQGRGVISEEWARYDYMRRLLLLTLFRAWHRKTGPVAENDLKKQVERAALKGLLARSNSEFDALFRQAVESIGEYIDYGRNGSKSLPRVGGEVAAQAILNRFLKDLGYQQ